MSSFKFVSWNIRGIGSPAKRTKILNHLNKLQADICLLQETHLSETEHKKLKTQHYNQIYSKKRGVSIIINKKVPLIHKNTIADPEGCYIIINGLINNNNITIASIYSPNTDYPDLFHNLFSSLRDLPTSTVIIGVDFNTVIDPTEDRSNNTQQKKNGTPLKQ